MHKDLRKQAPPPSRFLSAERNLLPNFLLSSQKEKKSNIHVRKGSKTKEFYLLNFPFRAHLKMCLWLFFSFAFSLSLLLSSIFQTLSTSSCFYDFPHFILSQDAVANEFYNLPFLSLSLDSFQQCIQSHRIVSLGEKEIFFVWVEHFLLIREYTHYVGQQQQKKRKRKIY
jgi:hypothetical protein